MKGCRKQRIGTVRPDTNEESHWSVKNLFMGLKAWFAVPSWVGGQITGHMENQTFSSCWELLKTLMQENGKVRFPGSISRIMNRRDKWLGVER